MSRFWGCGGGSVAIEYALIGALMSIVIIGIIAQIGEDVKAMFEKVVF